MLLLPVAASPTAPAAMRDETRLPWAYLLFMGAWLFDFQSEGQGQGLEAQAYFAAAYLLGLIAYLIGDRNSQGQIQGLFATIAAGTLYLVVGIAMGLIEEQSTYMIFRNALTVAIYLSGMYVTARMVMRADQAKLRSTLGIFCLLFALWNFAFAYISKGGIDFAAVRYTIIGVSVISALAYLVLVLLFRLTKAELAAMAINLAIVLASVTRTYLLVIVAQAAILGGMFRQVLTPRVVAVGALAFMALVGVLIFGELQVQRWQDRLFGSGSYRTESWTVDMRLSEWTYMTNQWTRSIGHFLFGNGLAAETVYFLPSQLGYGTESMIGFGHNQHLSMVFTAGVIGGLPLLAVQLIHGAASWRFARLAVKNRHLNNETVFLGTWGALTVIGCLTANMFDSIFCYRGDALWYGIGTGLLLGARARFDPVNAPRRRPPEARRAPALATR